MASTTASRVPREEGSRGPDWAKARFGLRKTREAHKTLPRKARRPALSGNIPRILAALLVREGFVFPQGSEFFVGFQRSR
jgi:hypothetical protein